MAHKLSIEETRKMLEIKKKLIEVCSTKTKFSPAMFEQGHFFVICSARHINVSIKLKNEQETTGYLYVSGSIENGCDNWHSVALFTNAHTMIQLDEVAEIVISRQKDATSISNNLGYLQVADSTAFAVNFLSKKGIVLS